MSAKEAAFGLVKAEVEAARSGIAAQQDELVAREASLKADEAKWLADVHAKEEEFDRWRDEIQKSLGEISSWFKVIGKTNGKNVETIIFSIKRCHRHHGPTHNLNLSIYLEGDVYKVQDQVSAALSAWQARSETVLGSESPLVLSLESFLLRCQEMVTDFESDGLAVSEDAGALLGRAEALLLQVQALAHTASVHTDEEDTKHFKLSMETLKRNEADLLQRLAAAEAERDAKESLLKEAMQTAKEERRAAEARDAAAAEALRTAEAGNEVRTA